MLFARFSVAPSLPPFLALLAEVGELGGEGPFHVVAEAGQRAKREEKGLTQKDVADVLGITHIQYGRLESGKQEMDLSKLERVCALLGIHLVIAEGANDSIEAVERELARLRQALGGRQDN